ncbi:trypsin-like serine peptidase [Luteimonas panaciterrae]|uniref:trypsin-like serine peptidase n=1 Tax=Luteimonas panaciterrae TaxID=363885 RepID=UPI001CFB23D6|nr:serine protease [Luteimonas panaciterrae]
MIRKNVLSLALLAGLSGFTALVSAAEMGPSPVTAAPVAKALGGAEFATTGKAGAIRAVDLGLPEKAAFTAVAKRRAEQAKHGQPLEIGFARSVGRSRIDLNGLNWEALPDGSRGARFTLTSTNAVALRAGLQLRSTGKLGGDPAAVTLRFAGNDGRVFEEKGGDFANADTGWSPVVAGDTLTVEIVLPKGQRPSGLSLTVPQLSHLDVDPAASTRDLARATGVGASDSCEQDIVCRVNPSAGFLAASKAVARMVFTSGGGSYLCSGTLLNNSNSPKRQLFWTAAHCISTSTVASTLQTYWFFDATGCNNDTANPNAVTLTGGAYLRHANTTRDTSLLELKNAPPSGAVYAGWNSAAIASTNTAIEGIHHPAGDLKKYSLGKVTALSYSLDGKSPLYKVVWDAGVTEGGSSGSGLFTIDSSGTYQLRGGLYGGTSYCSAPKDPDGYSQLSGVWSSISSYFSP